MNEVQNDLKNSILSCSNVNNIDFMFNIFHVNVQGLISKIDEIETLLSDLNINVMCLTEHFVMFDNLINIQFSNHIISSYFSRANHIHGGSLIIVEKSLKVNEVAPIKEQSIECHIEICAVCIHVNKKNIIIISAYRPPSGNIHWFINNLTNALNIAYNLSDSVILCGDFNIDMKQKCQNTDVLFDVFESFELNTTTSDYTRVFTNVHGHTSFSAIDYMVSNLPKNNIKCELLNPNIADHLAHMLSINMNEPIRNTNEKISFNTRPISDENIAHFKFELSRINWQEMYLFDVNEAFSFFMEAMIWCYNVSCPFKTKTVYANKKLNKKEWLTQGLIQQSKNVKNLYWLWTQNPTTETKNLYHEEKSKYKGNIKNAKQNYYTKKINNSANKSKTMWSIVNSKLGRKHQTNNNINLKYADKCVSNKREVLDIFAEFFSTNASQMLHEYFGSNLSLPCTISSYNEQSIFIAPITTDEINKIIINLKNKKSAGFDGLTVNLLKQVKDNIIEHLTFLFNLSINEGYFPDVLKQALITPLHKKGPTDELQNYRQISILSAIAKIFERTVYNKINSFVEKKNILTVAQHGFRENRSTETATCHLLDHVYLNIDKGKYLVSLQFDLSKAFDTINKDLLKHKLYSMGIRGSILDWIMSYMEGRSLRVKLGDDMSKVQDLVLGVPQGSVLGPLLFMLYINNLPEQITSGHLTMFADDFTVTIASDTLEELQEKVKNTLEEVSAWSQRDKLILNESKTVFINFYIQKPLPDNTTLYSDITLTQCTKLLGTHIDSKLSFDTHLNHVCKQLNKAYFAIMQMKNTLNEESLLNMYYALAYSHLAHNILCWGSSVQFERVFLCQKRIIRLIFKLSYRESCKNTFRHKKVLTAPCIYILKCLMYVKKNMNLFEKLNNNHDYQTRHGDCLSIPRHSTASFKRSPKYNCISFYNNLPVEIKNIENYDKYKKAIKQMLLEGEYYSAKEFLQR